MKRLACRLYAQSDPETIGFGVGRVIRILLLAVDLLDAVTVFERGSMATSEYFDVMGIPITRGPAGT